MITAYPNGSAGTTINDASGENDGPGLLTYGAVAAAAYLAYQTLIGGS